MFLPSAVAVVLDRTDRRSLPIQIADHLRADIRSGQAAVGLRLPSSRKLAAELHVARGVVERAYEQLIAEGWLATAQGSGTFVAEAPSPVVTPIVKAAKTTEPALSRVELRPGVPWTPPRATAAWRRAWRDVGVLPPPFKDPDPAGDFELRSALSQLLARARGMSVEPERIVITSGATHGLGLALSALRSPDAVLALEDPGYRSAASAAVASGWSLFDVPVDAHGLRVDILEQSSQNVRGVYVTPSHQYPTGGLLPVSRRNQLIDFARARDVLLFEDDYDSEFRYDVAPLPALAQLAPDRVVYLGTVAKTLGSGIRLGWLVAPAELVERITAHRKSIGDFPSVPLQRALLSLLRDGEWDRAVRTARRRYRERDRSVENALSRFGELRGLGAGMHTTLMLDASVAEAVASEALRRGVEVPTVGESARTHTQPGGLVIGYGRVDAADLEYALEVIGDCLEDHPR
ncbi:GntR family transcriptional regulator [Rhodococcus sp. SRB_17]|uniref:MocR-like pyridoxine biosynthesis transcription factor PdxR n=1 Tax=Rhodococcus sp. OK302 TaxID=1882769 RepID=UPI000B93F6EE|nr:PLP-dependent aminotransferase family protein [Rhodococcus sp. OK302]NMM88264.1 GntR family transcriptional regulator [Rhodococcus sp. SRB_17]OYD67320.1 GntR family transcriptional regulator/MocR family aminotransferase [Rhodococcus sp. OK302]